MLLFQHCYRVVACDGRKVVEKLRKRTTRLQVVEQCPNRDPRPHKDGGSAENLRIAVNDTLFLPTKHLHLSSFTIADPTNR